MTAANPYDASLTTTRINLAANAAETTLSLYGYAVGSTDALGAETAYAYDGFARRTAVPKLGIVPLVFERCMMYDDRVPMAKPMRSINLWARPGRTCVHLNCFVKEGFFYGKL